MRISICILFLLISGLLSIKSSAQNIMISDSAFSRPNDTVVVSVEITNSKQFISFQFDLQIPDKVSFIGYSLQLSTRSTNHVAIGNLVGNNIVRVLAYSPNNSAFLGSSGKVLSLKLAIGNTRGEFPLALSNAIIGDSLSTNILTGVQNGLLSVYPLGINENLKSNPILNFNVIPNPVRENSVIEFSLKYASAIEVCLHDILGRQVFRKYLGEFSEGNHLVNLPAQICSSLMPGTMYQLGIEACTQKKEHSIVYRKIIK